MRISFFIGSLYGGGAERVICEMASFLSQKGHYIEILTVTNNSLKYEIDNNVIIKTIDTHNRIKPSYIRKIIKMCNLYRYIFSADVDAYVVFLPDTIRAFMVFKKMIKCPVIISERYAPRAYDDRTIKKLRSPYSKADGIVFQTENAYDFWNNKISVMPDHVIIPNAVPESFSQKPDAIYKDNYILGVGRFQKQKNFPLLIRAFSIVAKEYPELELVICGEGPLKQEYLSLIHSLDLNEKVKLPGQVKQIIPIMQRAKVFVLSSDYEGIPNALIEAMASGLPCVATDCLGGGARLLIKNGYNGLLVKTGDEKMMADAIKKIMSNEEFANYISENARKISDTYSPKKIYSQWEEYIMKICMQYRES